MSECKEHEDMDGCGWCECSLNYDLWKKATVEIEQKQSRIEWLEKGLRRISDGDHEPCAQYFADRDWETTTSIKHITPRS